MSIEAKLNLRLTKCEQTYGGLFRDCRFILTDVPSCTNEELKFLASMVACILDDIREVDGLLQVATLGPGLQSIAAAPLAFYRSTLLPNRVALKTLFDSLMKLPDLYEVNEDPENVHSSETSRPHNPDATPIWILIYYGLADLDDEDENTFTEDEIVAMRLVNSGLFNPDEWVRNLSDIEPILGKDANIRIAGHVRIRLRELNQSYILGNYLASIALARAVLEYALIDRAANLGFSALGDDQRYPNRAKKLSRLVEDASKKKPELKSCMEAILEAGNRVLHPSRRDNIVYTPLALRALALTSVNGLRNVVEVLYLC